MNNIWTFLLLTLAVACGNPHISSSKGGLEKTNSPIEEGCIPPDGEVSDYRFFMNESAPSDYENFVKCRKVYREDFNIFADGTVPDLSNDDRADQPYVLTHRSEIDYDVDKVVHLDEIFGPATYNFDVLNPVTNNWETRLDRGVFSGSIDSTFKDAFVWKFSTPISFWSARPVGMKENSTLRIFNCSEDLVSELKITGTPRFIGFISAFENVCYVSLSAPSGTDSIAIDEIEYGN